LAKYEWKSPFTKKSPSPKSTITNIAIVMTILITNNSFLNMARPEISVIKKEIRNAPKKSLYVIVYPLNNNIFSDNEGRLEISGRVIRVLG